MKKSYQKLQQEYAKLKQEENAAMANLDEWLKHHTTKRETPPQRDPILLCSRNMAFLYLSACLCLKDETFGEKFKIHLYIVEAYAKQVFRRQDSVYLFLQIALCDIVPSVEPTIQLYMPDFIINAKTSETQTFIRYVMKLSNHLRKTSYPWYGKALLKSTIIALRSERFFITSNKTTFINRLMKELQTYNEN